VTDPPGRLGGPWSSNSTSPRHGRTIKLLNVIDNFTRECPATVVDPAIDATRSSPCSIASLRSEAPRVSVPFDNGPECVAYIVGDWCRLAVRASSRLK